jgi:hypothetical protein
LYFKKRILGTLKEHDPVGYHTKANKQTNNNKTSLNSITMSFETGFQASTRNEKLIAFWTHAIDKMLSNIEIVPDASFEEESNELYIPQNVLVKTGSSSIEEYLGAVRSGFHMMIQSLPSEVRIVIEQYIVNRLIESRKRLPDDVVDTDIVFGTGNPFA